MNKPLINPVKGKRDTVIDKPVVFLTNPWMYGDALEALKLKPFDKPNFNFTYLYSVDDRFYFVAYAAGAPWAVIVLEKLIACGAREIIVTGSCGSVSSKLRIGDLFIADKGIIEEGTSKAYGIKEGVSYPDTAQTGRLFDSLHGKKTVMGGIWTTDAPYNETRRKVKKFQRAGAMAVDMETSALFSVGGIRKAAVSSLLVVSDELFGREWVSGFTAQTLKQGIRELFACLEIFLVD